MYDDGVRDDVLLRWHPKIASRTLDGTAFVLLRSHMVSLNEVGSRVWELFEGGASVGSVATRIVSEFEIDLETAARDVRAFAKVLLARELLIVATGEEGQPVGAGRPGEDL